MASKDARLSAPTYRFYNGGELFSLKHLLGNAKLCDDIFTISKGKYEPLLPQDLPTPDLDPRAIRDADLLALLSSDLALFHFDGSDLDSGTVLEFLFAKCADIPCVLLRSDFRSAGDNSHAPWNLMVDGFPRTNNIILNSLTLYKHHAKASHNSVDRALLATREVATSVIDSFDELLTRAPVLSKTLRHAVYEWLSIMPDFKAPHDTANQIKSILSRKIKNGLL